MMLLSYLFHQMAKRLRHKGMQHGTQGLVAVNDVDIHLAQPVLSDHAGQRVQLQIAFAAAQPVAKERMTGFEPVTSSLPKICFTWRVGFRMSLIRCTSTTKMYSICLTQHQKPQYDNKKDTKKVRKWIDNAQTYSYNEIRYQMREENGRGKARYFAEKD